MFGKIQLEDFRPCELNQQAASAWCVLESLVGAHYKPLVYLGRQQVHGTNHYFIAEQTLVTNPITRHVVKLAIFELDGEYTLEGDSISIIA